MTPENTPTDPRLDAARSRLRPPMVAPGSILSRKDQIALTNADMGGHLEAIRQICAEVRRSIGLLR